MRLWACVGVAAVAAVIVTGASGGGAGATAAAKPTLAVVVVGGGRVASKPKGISCPGKCVAAFAAGSRVALTPKAKKGSRFLRWGGNCTGTRACTVRVSALSAVAAQFTPGTKSQPPPTTSVEPGGYSGTAGGYGVTFFVPDGARSVQNVSFPLVGVNCGGGGNYGTSLVILTATIKPDRSFTAKTSQSGVVGGANATITSSVTGRFQGRDSQGRATAAGAYRVDIVFADTPNRKCTSNEQPWTAARSQPPQTKSIEPGTYSGTAGGYGVTFFVPAGARSVQNVSFPLVGVNCGGGGNYGTSLKILTATIKPDRSFTAKTSQSGVVGGANATITSSVTGYFQGRDSQGRATAAGAYRVDIVFADTPNRKCTSNEQPWTAARRG